VTSGTGRKQVVRTAPLTVAKRIKVNYPDAVAVAPDGRTAYVTGTGYQTGGEVTAISTKNEHDGATRRARLRSSALDRDLAQRSMGICLRVQQRRAAEPRDEGCRSSGTGRPQGAAGSAVETGGISFTANGKLAYVIDETTSS
jgi:DNA-binding beta-propeller fold protein YncE